MKSLLTSFVVLAALAGNGLAQTVARGIVINEVYIGSGPLIGDQFIELYNPQSSTQYLDANMIVQFGANGGALSGRVLTGAVTAWKFPGRPGGRQLPLGPGQFAVIAASATNGKALDLSKAAYEAHGALASGNPNATQLHTLSPAMSYPGLTPSPIADAIVLTDGTDSVITDGVLLTSVIDGMQYDTAWIAGHLPASIDAGHTGGPNLKFGVSMERNSKGVTTRNSSTDFALYLPTPGVQHGSLPPPTPVTPKILYPLDLGRFVDLNHYDTSSTDGTITKYRSSQTVMGTGLNFQGVSGVGWVRDSSYVSVSSSAVSDLHFHATAAGDIQIFGDQELLNYALGSMASNFTPPNTWLDYFKMTSGVGTSYPVGTVNGTYGSGFASATITITFTGMYKGIERVVVPRGTYDSAYRFDLTASVVISSLLGQNSFNSVNTFLLVRGIGIIRVSNAHAGTTVGGNPINIDGAEKEMTAYGVQSLAVHEAPTLPRALPRIYPNPASDATTIMLELPAREILLYGANGELIRSYYLAGGQQTALLWVKDIPNGKYLASIRYANGSSAVAPIVVSH
ncbi:MAG: hypothetical protein Q8922_11840 [Bacteroidota bacterium]|nr:hypothetical protein [Bacteroidota bacterium]MDP4233274.1 hypothetical protein [Bacteroidota bacterium]MDP4242106.1 hypothetical protein [Bacteroidota bacterium]MDP4288615.1 hypothetical protein [Bacteroidota bacterium]